MAELQSSLRGLLNWYLDTRSLSIDLEGEHRAIELAGHIATCYAEVLDRPFKQCEYTQVRVDVEGMKEGLYLAEDVDYRGRVIALRNYIRESLSPFVKHAFLLGSLATLDYSKGWSDVDCFLCIKNETVTSAQSLYRLRQKCLDSWRYFTAICPLQHHGFICVTELDLECYSSSWMPPVVFKKSTSLIGSDTALFSINRSESGSLQSIRSRLEAVRDSANTGLLKHHPYQGVYLERELNNKENGMYQLFCMLGYIMTIPSYVMDAVREPCHKRDSFRLARKLLSQASWNTIDKASKIRSLWEEREGVDYLPNAIPDWVVEIVGKNCMEEWEYVLSDALSVAQRQY